MKKLICLLLVLAACNSRKESTTKQPLTLSKIMGVYTGVTPCADCEGIYTRIEFIDSITYIKSSVYIGKSNREFLDMGQWRMHNDSVIMLATLGGSQYYLHEGLGLVMLNQQVQRIKGALANYYKLTKGEPEKRKDYKTATASAIDFVAQGNEPGWSVEIDFDKKYFFNTLDDDSIRTSVQKITTIGAASVLKSASGSDSLIIKLSPTGCINSMSGAYSDYAVEVKFNNTLYAGCGEFINNLYRLNGRWTLATLNDQSVNGSDYNKTLPELIFNAIEKRVSGSTGCNRLSGGFIAEEDGRLSFSPLATTRMMCPGKGENIFLKALEGVTAYKIEGDKLLLMKGDAIVMTFVAADL